MNLHTPITNHLISCSSSQWYCLSDSTQDNSEQSSDNSEIQTSFLKSRDDKDLKITDLSCKYEEIQVSEPLELERTTNIESSQTKWNEHHPKEFGKNVIQTIQIFNSDLESNTNALLQDEKSFENRPSINLSQKHKLNNVTTVPINDDPNVSNSDPSKLSTSPIPSKSGSLVYKTKVTAMSLNGSVVESEVTRNYVLPLDNKSLASQEQDNQTEKYQLCTNDIQHDDQFESGRQNINVSTTLKVVQVNEHQSNRSVNNLVNAPLSESQPTASNGNENLITDAHYTDLNTNLYQTNEIPEELVHSPTLLDSNNYISPDKSHSTDIICHTEPIKSDSHLVCSINHENEQQSCSKSAAASPNLKCPGSNKTSKINADAKQHLDMLTERIRTVCVDLQHILDGIPQRNYDACTTCLGHFFEATDILRQLTKKLDYSPYEVDLKNDYNGLMEILGKCKESSALILLHLVQIGYYFYEVGRLLQTDILPSCFAPLVHAIQNRLRTLCNGRISRQIIYVPISFDPIVSTYYRDRRLERIENYCNCQIKLLSPTDPNATNCPSGYRALEVKFDPVDGRYVGFSDVFRRSLCIDKNVVRIGATIFKKYDGTEFQPNATQLLELERNLPRCRLLDVKSQLASGNKLLNTELGT